jgi:hypothetical protein
MKIPAINRRRFILTTTGAVGSLVLLPSLAWSMAASGKLKPLIPETLPGEWEQTASQRRAIFEQPRRPWLTRRINPLPLDENGVASMLAGIHELNGFIMVSAWRAASAELGIAPENVTEEQEKAQLATNKDRDAKLRTILREMRIGFIPLAGTYSVALSGRDDEVSETSYVLLTAKAGGQPVSHQELYALGQDVCSTFNQQSFLYVPGRWTGNPRAHLIDRDGFSLSEPSEDVNQYASIYFAQMRTGRLLLKRERASAQVEAAPLRLYVNAWWQGWMEAMGRSSSGEIPVSPAALNAGRIEAIGSRMSLPVAILTEKLDNAVTQDDRREALTGRRERFLP